MEIISYILNVLPFFVVFGFAFVIIVIMVLSTSTPWLVIVIMCLAFISDTASIQPLAVNLGLLIYPSDVFAIFASCGLIVRVIWMKRGNYINISWWVLGGVQFILFVWGLSRFGTGSGVDYRTHFAAWVGAAYFATFTQDDKFIRRFFLVVQMIAIGMMVVAMYRWVWGEIDPKFGSEIDLFITTGVPFRVIWSAATFMIAVAMLTSMFYASKGNSNGSHWLLVIVYATFVLVLQHRTVWVAALGGVGVLAFLLSKAQTGAGMKMLAIGIGLCVLVGVLATSLQGVSNSIQDQASRAVGEGGTFQGGRVTSWVALLKDWAGSASPVTYLIGKPFGSGYERYTSDFAQHAVTYQPHNYYVHLLYRGGIIGLGAFLWTMWQALSVLRRQFSNNEMYASLLMAMLGALMLYYIPYAVSYEQAIFLAMLLGSIARDKVIK